MTNRQTTKIDKVVYGFLILAFMATFIILLLGGHTNRSPNIDSIIARNKLLPIKTNQSSTIISSKNDAGKSHRLRWFEKVLISNTDSKNVTETLAYSCKQEDIINFVKNMNGNFNIRFITKTNNKFSYERIVNDINFNPDVDCNTPK